MPNSSVTQTSTTTRAVADLGDYVRENTGANCHGQGFTNPDANVWMFEPETTDPEVRSTYAATVARACHGCPVRSACLLYALATEQAEGVMPGAWGGLPSWEREALIRRARGKGYDLVNTDMIASLLANERRVREHSPASTRPRVRSHANADANAGAHARTREVAA